MPSPTQRPLNLFPAAMAWVWPGAGHIVLGHKRRGRLIMLGVLFTFLAGLFIGGVDCVDHKEDRLWFLAQAVCGPVAFAADFTNQGVLKTKPDAERFTNGSIALGRVNEMGTLFCALAGLMNLVVILDALTLEPYVPNRRRRTEDTSSDNAGRGGAA